MSFDGRLKNIKSDTNQKFTSSSMINKASHKRILCQNILISKKCNYGDKCIYAHSLSEQKIDPLRKKAYDLFNQSDLSMIDLSLDKKMYDSLVQISKLCINCKNMECQGGYNCREGAYSSDYVVCYDDITYGNCRKVDCKKKHFSKNGMQPFRKLKKTFPSRRIFDDNQFDFQNVLDNNLEIENNYLSKLIGDNTKTDKIMLPPGFSEISKDADNILEIFDDNTKLSPDNSNVKHSVNTMINRHSYFEFSDSSDDFNIYVGIEPTSDSDNESIFY